MSKITSSGIYYDEFGQLILVTQGVGGYTLVANKKILFRLFLDLPDTSSVTVLATVTFNIIGFSVTKSFAIPSESLLIESAGPNGPSIGVVFAGDVFPFASWIHYDVDFSVHGASSSMAQFRIRDLEFSAPGRLRLLIHNLVGTSPSGTKFEPNFGLLVEMFQSLERLSAMLPVRDGIKLGLGHSDAGLCFVYGENIDSWPQVCPSGSPPPCTQPEMVELILGETTQINAAGTSDRVDATVAWRPRDAAAFPPPGGETTGGTAFSYDVAPGTGLALVVGGNEGGKELTASIMAQEIGHLFGLEPRESPHFDPLDEGHSKDRAVPDPFAFDFLLLKPYRPPPGKFLGDVMNGRSGGVWQGKDMVLYNAFDWEHLRKRFVRLPGSPRPRAAAKRPSKEQRDTLLAALRKSFGGETEIKIGDLGKVLPTKRGYTWHWTARGFQLASESKGARRKSRLAPSVEGIRCWLDDLGIKNVYAPVGDRPLGMVISPKAYTSLRRKKPEAFGWVEALR